jgi:hypothetical protein
VASHPASNPMTIQAMTLMSLSRIKMQQRGKIYTTSSQKRADLRWLVCRFPTQR